MEASTLEYDCGPRNLTRSRMIRDYIILAKPRISVMVVLTVAVAALISWPESGASPWRLIHAMIGLMLVSASGCAVNQYLERYVDWLMPRTAKRPLPDNRLSAGQVAVFGAVTLGAGTAWLAALVNWQTLVVALSSWVVYVVIYTPLKAHTWLNTFVGAVAGALPVLVGSTAITEGAITTQAWWLFALLYIWQFPHFMAIAWLYRADYERGALQMASTVKHAERLTAVVAVIFALAHLPVTALAFWPNTIVAASGCALGTALALWYISASVLFAQNVNDATARVLFRVSLIYLPLYLALLSLTAAFQPG